MKRIYSLRSLLWRCRGAPRPLGGGGRRVLAPRPLLLLLRRLRAQPLPAPRRRLGRGAGAAGGAGQGDVGGLSGGAGAAAQQRGDGRRRHLAAGAPGGRRLLRLLARCGCRAATFLRLRQETYLGLQLSFLVGELADLVEGGGEVLPAPLVGGLELLQAEGRQPGQGALGRLRYKTRIKFKIQIDFQERVKLKVWILKTRQPRPDLPGLLGGHKVGLDHVEHLHLAELLPLLVLPGGGAGPLRLLLQPVRVALEELDLPDQPFGGPLEVGLVLLQSGQQAHRVLGLRI